MLETHDKYEFRVVWQPFLLRQGIPPEGVLKAPNTASNPRVSANLKGAGQSVGIDFTGKADRYPNTVKAHVLLEMTQKDTELQNKLAEALFKAYFTDGSSLIDEDLLAIAESVGIPHDEALNALKDEARYEETINKALSYSRRGVSGVPMFYMNEQRTFSGAQEKNAFTHMFGIVAERFPAQQSGL